MDVEPLDYVEPPGETPGETQTRAAARGEREAKRLNAWVAITVALLATFLGVCKVKDDNIVQAMQQAQAKAVDDWNWYQARIIRAEVAQATADQIHVAAAAAAPHTRGAIAAQAAVY